MMRRLLCLCALCLVLPACVAVGAVMPKGAVRPLPKGNRILAVDVNTAESNDYNAAFAMAKGVGMQDIGLSLDWRDIESETGKYDGKWLSIANMYYPKTGTGLTLNLRPIHNCRKMMPVDLETLKLDDPRMIGRFEKLLDFVFAQIPDTKLDALVIGSEIDVYLGASDDLWREFTAFYKTVGAYAKTKRPGMKVASESTLSGVLGAAKGKFIELNRYSDLIGVSHYPIEGTFSVQDPSMVGKVFDDVTALYPKRTICFYQWGYPSSPMLNSSEAKQARFVRETFKAWDRHAVQVQLVDFTWLHDLPQSSLDADARYYGLSDPRFIEFLRTLGMRTYPGQGRDKESFRTLKSEAKARGWGTP